MHKTLILLQGMLFAMQAQAFPCFITMVKDSCWTDYNLTVVVTDPATEKALATVNVVQGTSWARAKFDCQPKESLSMQASFTPVFWETDTGKTYAARRNWSLPETIKKGDTAWNITVCYPKEFAEVPFPPNVGGNCNCDTDTIPPIKPQ